MEKERWWWGGGLKKKLQHRTSFTMNFQQHRQQSFDKYLPAQSTVVSVQEHVNGHSANEDDPKCAFAFSCVLTTSPGGAYPKSAVL
jgi:hypothetical protein